MKEAKKANKRLPNGAIKRDNADIKDEDLIDANPDQSSPSRQVTRNRAQNKAKRARRRQTAQEDDSDLDYSPIRGNRQVDSSFLSPLADFDFTDVPNESPTSSLP